MKEYRFLFAGTRHARVGDDGITFSPSVSDFSLRTQHWPRRDIVAVSVQEAARQTVRCEVAVTRRDGSVRRFHGVVRPAAEVASAFAVRGYPDERGNVRPAGSDRR